MIRDYETQGLIEKIGKRHISRIKQYFFENEITNRDGEPFSDSYISRVLHGKKQNDTVEKGIWDFAEHLNEKEEEDIAKKKSILNPKKKASDEK